MRVTPLLVPRLSNYAARVQVKTKAFATIPAATLVNKLITGTTSPEGNYHETYQCMREGDPEAFMTLTLTVDGVVECVVSRGCAAGFEVLLDNTVIVSFEETAGDGPWLGYTVFRIATE